jgi:hypothetical protein
VEVIVPNAAQERATLESRVASLDNTIATEEERARRSIEKQATAPASLSDIYDSEINRLGQRLEILRNERLLALVKRRGTARTKTGS